MKFEIGDRVHPYPANSLYGSLVGTVAQSAFSDYDGREWIVIVYDGLLAGVSEKGNYWADTCRLEETKGHPLTSVFK